MFYGTGSQNFSYTLAVFNDDLVAIPPPYLTTTTTTTIIIIIVIFEVV